MSIPNSTTTNPWLFAGPVSSFPNIEPSKSTKTKLTSSSSSDLAFPPCKVFQHSSTNLTTLTPDSAVQSIGLTPQLLIFRYRNKFHALNNQCPHQSYPLMRGTLYDIEDFGIVLSAGITCPRHGWSFDLWTGESDTGRYKVEVWDVEVRKVQGVGDGDGEDGQTEEVWVRRKRGGGRIG